MSIRAVGKSFVFKFKDEVKSNGEFAKKATDTGIVLNSSADDSAKQARWVIVESAGKDTGLVTGQEVLLPPLRWTESATFEGGKLWKSDIEQIVGYINEHGRFEVHNEYVIFSPSSRTKLSEQSGLVIVGGNHESASGIGVAVTEGGVRELVGAKVFYNDSNFFETFTIGDTKLAYIKEQEILAYIPKEE